MEHTWSPYNLPCGLSIMASQSHSSWRLFHLQYLPSQLTHYITVHLISKDTLTTPLNKDEKSCSVMLTAPEHVSLLSVYVCAPTTSACATRPTMHLPHQHVSLYIITPFYPPLTRTLEKNWNTNRNHLLMLFSQWIVTSVAHYAVTSPASARWQVLKRKKAT